MQSIKTLTVYLGSSGHAHPVFEVAGLGVGKQSHRAARSRGPGRGGGDHLVEGPGGKPGCKKYDKCDCQCVHKNLLLTRRELSVC